MRVGFRIVVSSAVIVLAVASCAAQSIDYTPPIRVVEGAAARSLWIPSKKAKEEAAQAKEEGDGEEEPEQEASSGGGEGVGAGSGASADGGAE
jgi:hypothetical protein